MTGAPGRSVLQNTIPCPEGAPRHTAVTDEPVCRPTPLTRASCASVLLGTGNPLRDQSLQFIHDWRQPIQGGLGSQELAMRPRWMTAEGGARGDIAEDRALGRDASSISDREVIGDPDMPREDDVIADARAARDADSGHDQAAFADPDVVSHLHQVIELGAAPDDSVVDA